MSRPLKISLAFPGAACYNAYQCCVEPPGSWDVAPHFYGVRRPKGRFKDIGRLSLSSGTWGACVSHLSGVAGPGQGDGAASVSMRSFLARRDGSGPPYIRKNLSPSGADEIKKEYLWQKS